MWQVQLELDKPPLPAALAAAALDAIIDTVLAAACVAATPPPPPVPPLPPVLFVLTDSLGVALSISISFVFGASLSASAGWWGMMVATYGNAMTTV